MDCSCPLLLLLTTGIGLLLCSIPLYLNLRATNPIQLHQDLRAWYTYVFCEDVTFEVFYIEEKETHTFGQITASNQVFNVTQKQGGIRVSLRNREECIMSYPEFYLGNGHWITQLYTKCDTVYPGKTLATLSLNSSSTTVATKLVANLSVCFRNVKINLGYDPWAECKKGTCNSISATLQPLPSGSVYTISSNKVFNFSPSKAKLVIKHKGTKNLNTTVTFKLSTETRERSTQLYDCLGKNLLTYSLDLTSSTKIEYIKVSGSTCYSGITVNLGYPWAQCVKGGCSNITASLQELPNATEQPVGSNSVFNFPSNQTKLYLRQNGTEVDTNITLKLSSEEYARTIRLYKCGNQNNAEYNLTLNSSSTIEYINTSSSSTPCYSSIQINLGYHNSSSSSNSSSSPGSNSSSSNHSDNHSPLDSLESSYKSHPSEKWILSVIIVLTSIIAAGYA